MISDQIHCMDNPLIFSAKDNPEHIHICHFHQASEEEICIWNFILRSLIAAILRQ